MNIGSLYYIQERTVLATHRTRTVMITNLGHAGLWYQLLGFTLTLILCLITIQCAGLALAVLKTGCA